MRFPGFIGPSYSFAARRADCQRCVNWFPVMNALGTGKEREVAKLKYTPGLRKILEVGDGPIRCVHVDAGGRILVVSGKKLFRVIYSGGEWSSSQIPDRELTTDTGTVIARSAILSETAVDGDGEPLYTYDAWDTVFVDGENCYFYQFALNPDGSESQSFVGMDLEEGVKCPGEAFPTGRIGVPGATHVDWIDGYFIFNKRNSRKFYITGLNELDVSPLDFASAEGDPDDVLALIASDRDLWLIGQKSTEGWSNTGNADFPFERLSGGFHEAGIFAAYSLKKIGSDKFWLGITEKGEVGVYRAHGLIPGKISTEPIDEAIRSYARPETATAYTYSDNGHSFYVINFDEATWVFDLSTGLWHERAFTSNGELKRWRGNVHDYSALTRSHLVGDHESNKLYVMDPDCSTDDSNPITRMRTAPHISDGMARIFHNSFQLDLEVGVGLDGDVQGSDPQAILDWSDDGGYKYGNEHWRSIGKIGQRKKRVKWDRLGSSFDRVYRLRITDPVQADLLGAEIDIEKGAS